MAASASPGHRRMTALVERIPAMRGRRVCVLATGDPMQFGIGATLAGRVAAEEMTVAAARLRLLARRRAARLAARPRALLTCMGDRSRALARHVAPGARLIILAHDGSTPAAVARCAARAAASARAAWSRSPIWAAPRSRGTRRWRGISTRAVPDFHTLGVECIAGPDAIWHPRTGLPDDAFEHDGKLTKREVRALALAKLMPHAGALSGRCRRRLRLGRHRMAARGGPHAKRSRWSRAPTAAPWPRGMPRRSACRISTFATAARRRRWPGCREPDAIFIGGGVSDATIAAVARQAEAGRTPRRPCRDAGERGGAARRLCARTAASSCASPSRAPSRSAPSPAGGRRCRSRNGRGGRRERPALRHRRRPRRSRADDAEGGAHPRPKFR